MLKNHRFQLKYIYILYNLPTDNVIFKFAFNIITNIKTPYMYIGIIIIYLYYI